MVILVSSMGRFLSQPYQPCDQNSLPIQGLILHLGCKTKNLSSSVDFVPGVFLGCVLF